MPVRIFSSIPSPVKITWNGQTLYRYLWGISPFPVETNCPHLEHQPPFYTTVGHIPVPGEFHEGRLVTAMPLNPSQHTLTAPSALLCLSSPVAYNSKLSPAKVSQPQSAYADSPFRPALSFIPSRLQRNSHSEESPLGELPAAVAVAAGVRIFRLRCQYASSRQYHLP